MNVIAGIRERIDAQRVPASEPAQCPPDRLIMLEATQ
jgi:hypothetical protein